MIHYKATFSDGKEICRSTHSEYNYAFRIIGYSSPCNLEQIPDMTYIKRPAKKNYFNLGFSYSKEQAIKNARQFLPSKKFCGQEFLYDVRRLISVMETTIEIAKVETINALEAKRIRSQEGNQFPSSYALV